VGELCVLSGDVLTSDLDTSTRLAPSAASAVAQASPIPMDAPVRNTTLPWRDMLVFVFVCVCCGYCIFRCHSRCLTPAEMQERWKLRMQSVDLMMLMT
jgi:hypothetical protein